MRGMKTPARIDDVLRQAIRASGLTHYRIAKDAGIATAILDRFMSEERDMRLATAAKVAQVLGLKAVKISEKTS